MSLRIYNTLSKQKELFTPVNPGKVGIYVCGPTVYKPPHIGHMVGPVIFDAIKRYLQYKGYEVTWVVNITDVDDKIIERATELGQDWKQVAEIATKQYMDCLALLNVDTIDKFPKASEHMNEIQAMTQKLIDRGFAYASEGNVWFEVGKDGEYGKLSNRKVEEQEAGTREITGSGKSNPADFALWKATKPGEPAWESLWGPGRPGWHIECSAMSQKYLGETFDIHGGGMDLMFPHHENELAQSECCNGKTFAKFWMHNGLTRIATKTAGGELKQEKMSKSLGNVLDPVALVGEHGAEFIRYLLLSTHYRSPIDFSDDVIQSSKKGLAVFQRLFERVERLTGKKFSEVGPDMDLAANGIFDTDHAPFARTVLGLKMKFMEMMDDDFNTAGAIAVLHELAGEINGHIEKHVIEKSKAVELVGHVTAATATLRNMGNVIGLFRPPPAGASEDKDNALLDTVMKFVIQLRKDARASKNFTLADSIRDGLAKIGVTLEDRPDGTGWRKG
ncbi:cysteine--tRNA ligase [soil metagenome]